MPPKTIEEYKDEYEALTKACIKASAELRHAYKCKTDWNLVARAIEILEKAASQY